MLCDVIMLSGKILEGTAVDNSFTYLLSIVNFIADIVVILGNLPQDLGKEF